MQVFQRGSLKVAGNRCVGNMVLQGQLQQNAKTELQQASSTLAASCVRFVSKSSLASCCLLTYLSSNLVSKHGSRQVPRWTAKSQPVRAELARAYSHPVNGLNVHDRSSASMSSFHYKFRSPTLNLCNCIFAVLPWHFSLLYVNGFSLITRT